MAKRICVTGAAGRAGRAVVRELLEHGFDVAATDAAAAQQGEKWDKLSSEVGVEILRADTVMNRPSAHLLDEVFPAVPVTRELGEFDTLLAIDRARTFLGYEPRHSWRDHVPAPT